MTDFFQNNAVTSYPEITQTDFKSINKRYFKVIVIQTTLIFTVLFIAIIFMNYKDLFEWSEYSVWLYVMLSFIFIVILFLKIIGFKNHCL